MDEAMRSEAMSRFSICELSTPDLTFEEDLELYSQVGAAGISVCETKLDDEDDDARRVAAMKEAGLKCAVAIPTNNGVLTCGNLFPGPEDIDERIEAMKGSIRRLAPFEPDTIVVLTGSPRERTAREAREVAVRGLREASAVAAEYGFNLSLEPIREDLDLDVSTVATIAETLDLIAEVGAPNLDICYDVYHLWDQPDVNAETERHADQIGGVHICDWREPPRLGIGDRLVPGDGEMDLPPVIAALERGGYKGWYDIEIFSDKDLPDSLWNRPPREFLERSRDGYLEAWARAADLLKDAV